MIRLGEKCGIDDTKTKQREESQKKLSKWLLVIFFPITGYAFLGFILLSLLSNLEKFSVFLIKRSGYPVNAKKLPDIKWHKINVGITLFFPLTVPLFASFEIIMLLYAIIAFISGIIRKIFIFAFDYVNKLWESISNMFH